MRLRSALSLVLNSALLFAPDLARSSAQEPPGGAQAETHTLDPSAEYDLGNKLFFSTPVSPHSLAEGIMYYRASANSGYVLAQKMLGGIYDRGIRVAKDYSEAAHWYELAAEGGDNDSQCELGRLYEEGLGVAKNLAIAVYWYQKAEEQGNTLAPKYRKGLTDIGVTARAPEPTQLPPVATAYSSVLLEPTLERTLRAEPTAPDTPAEPTRTQGPPPSSNIAIQANSSSGSPCVKSIAFAIVEGRSVASLIPDFAEKWVKNNQRKFPGLCFSQLPVPGAQNYVFVFSTAQDSLSGFQPVVRTSTSTSTSPVQGGGTITSSSGGMWQYTYDGTVTTTTTTTSTQDVPYTLRESTLYLTVYNSYGSMVRQRWASDSRQLGGDPYQALGHNLGMALRNIHIKERLLKACVEDITGK
jgi:hypothetical protein